jgi:UDP-GlcNAc:undecaprenyl-phosphate GlcNAc-1-phosphate transferase
MTTIAVAFVLSLACSAGFTPLTIRLAHRLNAIDHALSSRKIHGRPVPRLGGLAIAAAFFVPITGLALVDSGVGRLFYGDGLRPLGLYVGGAIIALLGVYDDLKGAGARLKFSVQFAVGALVYFLGFRIDALANPFGPALQLGWLGLPFTMIWIAGVINAINLIDGLDGLAGGVALVAVAMTFVFALLQQQPLMMLFSAALAGGIIGFLRYNWNPARIFMGDTGSMFLGFVLATSAIQTNHKSSTTVAILVPIVVLGFPIADTLLAMGRRAMRGAPLFHADRGHIHHRLLDLGLSQRAAVLVLWGASVLLGVTALAIAYASSAQAGAILGLLAVTGGLVLRRLGYLQVERVREVLEVRRRNLQRRATLSALAGRLHEALEVRDVWHTLELAAPVLGAESVNLRLTPARPWAPLERRNDAVGFDDAGRNLLRTRHNLLGARPGVNVLELGWSARASLDRDTESAVETLCDHLGSALSRIEREDAYRPLKDERVKLVTT